MPYLAKYKICDYICGAVIRTNQFMQKIIGRHKEISELNEIYQSGAPEFVVIYGRRRVGKTFLIRELYEGSFAFYHTGLSPQDVDESNMLASQLSNFGSSLRNFGIQCGVLKDWLTAFDRLKEHLISEISSDSTKRQVVFIDELPWMDTPRSQFISAFEHFWNGWGAGVPQLMLIVCGSATSWIADNVLRSKGGLYNRRTREIKIHPFSLRESEEFYKEHGIVLNRYDQMRLYMMLGGIPYYLTFVQKGQSVEQLVDVLFADRDGKLRDEMGQLFASLFTNHEECTKIVSLLSKRKNGYTRKEISDITKIPYGGGLTKTLNTLIESDFISRYTYYGKPSKEERYRLIDFFTLFQLTVVTRRNSPDSKNWNDRFGTKVLSTWYGFAFETLCWNHIYQIKFTLGIPSVHTEQFSWRFEGSEDSSGAQIDLMIRRADNIFNLCEMKFSIGDYSFSNVEESALRNRIATFMRITKCSESIMPILVTTYGLTPNIHSSLIQQTVTMDDLFR